MVYERSLATLFLLTCSALLPAAPSGGGKLYCSTWSHGDLPKGIIYLLPHAGCFRRLVAAKPFLPWCSYGSPYMLPCCVSLRALRSTLLSTQCSLSAPPSTPVAADLPLLHIVYLFTAVLSALSCSISQTPVAAYGLLLHRCPRQQSTCSPCCVPPAPFTPPHSSSLLVVSSSSYPFQRSISGLMF